MGLDVPGLLSCASYQRPWGSRDGGGRSHLRRPGRGLQGGSDSPWWPQVPNAAHLTEGGRGRGWGGGPAAWSLQPLPTRHHRHEQRQSHRASHLVRCSAVAAFKCSVNLNKGPTNYVACPAHITWSPHTPGLPQCPLQGAHPPGSTYVSSGHLDCAPASLARHPSRDFLDYFLSLHLGRGRPRGPAQLSWCPLPLIPKGPQLVPGFPHT